MVWSTYAIRQRQNANAITDIALHDRYPGDNGANLISGTKTNIQVPLATLTDLKRVWTGSIKVPVPGLKWVRFVSLWNGANYVGCHAVGGIDIEVDRIATDGTIYINGDIGQNSKVVFMGPNVPPELTEGATYVVVSSTAGRIKVATDLTLPAITFATATTLSLSVSLISECYYAYAGLFEYTQLELLERYRGIDIVVSGFRFDANTPTRIVMGPSETYDLKQHILGSTTGITRAYEDSSFTDALTAIGITIDPLNGLVSTSADFAEGIVDNVLIYATDQPFIEPSLYFLPNYTDFQLQPHDGPLSGVSAEGWSGWNSFLLSWRDTKAVPVMDNWDRRDQRTTQENGAIPPLTGGRWASYSATNVPWYATQSIDVTAWAQNTAGTKATGQKTRNYGLYLQFISAGSNYAIAARDYSESVGVFNILNSSGTVIGQSPPTPYPDVAGTPKPAYYPRLLINGTTSLVAVSDVMCDTSGSQPTGAAISMNLKTGAYNGLILFFDLSGISGASISTAVLQFVYVPKPGRTPGATGTNGTAPPAPTGTVSADVYRIDPPWKTEPYWPLPPITTGIAAAYPYDIGIEDDPDVLFAERFDGKRYDRNGNLVAQNIDFRKDNWSDWVVQDQTGDNYGQLIVGDETEFGQWTALWPEQRLMRIYWNGCDSKVYAFPKVSATDFQVPVINLDGTWDAGERFWKTASGSNYESVAYFKYGYTPFYLECASAPSPFVQKTWKGTKMDYRRQAVQVGDGVYFAKRVEGTTKFTVHAEPYGPPIMPSRASTVADNLKIWNVNPQGTTPISCFPQMKNMPRTADKAFNQLQSSENEMYWREIYIFGKTYRSDIQGCKQPYAAWDGRYESLYESGMGLGNSGTIPAGTPGWSSRGHSEVSQYQNDTPFCNDYVEGIGTYTYCAGAVSFNSGLDAFRRFQGNSPFGFVRGFNDWTLGMIKCGTHIDIESGIRMNTVVPNDIPVMVGSQIEIVSVLAGGIFVCKTAHGMTSKTVWPGNFAKMLVARDQASIGQATPPGFTVTYQKSDYDPNMASSLDLARSTEYWYVPVTANDGSIDPLRFRLSLTENGAPITTSTDWIAPTYTVTTGTGASQVTTIISMLKMSTTVRYDARHEDVAFGGPGSGAYPNTFRSRFKLPSVWESTGYFAYSETLNSILSPRTATLGTQFWANRSQPYNYAALMTNEHFRAQHLSRLPTRGRYDGISWYWLWGRLVETRPGWRMRDVMYRTDGGPFQINSPWITAAVGGNSRNFFDSWTGIGNIVVAKKRIGPLNLNGRVVQWQS